MFDITTDGGGIVAKFDEVELWRVEGCDAPFWPFEEYKWLCCGDPCWECERVLEYPLRWSCPAYMLILS